MFVDTSTGSDGVALSLVSPAFWTEPQNLVGAPHRKRRRGETLLVNCSVRDTLTRLVTGHPDHGDTTRRAALKI